MLWLRMFVGKTWVSLLRCLDVPKMMKSILLALSLRVLFVIQPEISLRQSPSCLRERSVSAVDKYMHTRVSSAYKWWSNVWLSGVIYRVNSSDPWTEPWETLHTKALPLKTNSLFLLIETYLLRMSWSRWVLCHICHTNQRRSRRTEKSMVSKSADKLNTVGAVTLPLSIFSDMSLKNIFFDTPFRCQLAVCHWFVFTFIPTLMYCNHVNIWYRRIHLFHKVFWIYWFTFLWKYWSENIFLLATSLF